jgi:hypothetical protein
MTVGILGSQDHPPGPPCATSGRLLLGTAAPAPAVERVFVGLRLAPWLENVPSGDKMGLRTLKDPMGGSPHGGSP